MQLHLGFPPERLHFHKNEYLFHRSISCERVLAVLPAIGTASSTGGASWHADIAAIMHRGHRPQGGRCSKGRALGFSVQNLWQGRQSTTGANSAGAVYGAVGLNVLTQGKDSRLKLCSYSNWT